MTGTYHTNDLDYEAVACVVNIRAVVVVAQVGTREEDTFQEDP